MNENEEMELIEEDKFSEEDINILEQIFHELEETDLNQEESLTSIWEDWFGDYDREIALVPIGDVILC